MPNACFHRHVLVVALLAATCGCVHGTVGNAETSFAHFPPPALLGTPLGMIEALRGGHKTNFERIRVCVEKPAAGPTAQEFLLEARLSYASWILAAGSEADWRLFDFQVADRCAFEKRAFAASLRIMKLGEKRADSADLAKAFKAPEVTCTRTGNVSHCASDANVRGVATPGAIRTFADSRTPERWLRLELAEPARLVLSPHVEWRSIRWALRNNPSLPETRRTRLLDAYEALLRAQEPAFQALADFVRALDGVEQREDPGFERAADSARGKASRKGTSYRAEAAMFHPLLHETGHQFGLDHPDAPDKESVTASSRVTKDATMAYGTHFLHLTESDRSGIRAVRASVREFLRAHL